MAKIPMSKMTPEELDSLYQDALDRERYNAVCWSDESDDSIIQEDDWPDSIEEAEVDDFDLEEFEENRRRRIAEANEY